MRKNAEGSGDTTSCYKRGSLCFSSSRLFFVRRICWCSLCMPHV